MSQNKKNINLMWFKNTTYIFSYYPSIDPLTFEMSIIIHLYKILFLRYHNILLFLKILCEIHSISTILKIILSSLREHLKAEFTSISFQFLFKELLIPLQCNYIINCMKNIKINIKRIHLPRYLTPHHT